MPRHHRLPILAAVAACALAGCSQTPAPVSIPPAASSPATPAAAQSSASSAPGSTTPATPPAPGASAGGVAGAAHRCETAQLSLTVALTSGPHPRGALLRFLNTGTTACRMTGFPGVDLQGPNDPTFGPTYQIPRASTTITTVTIPPSSTAHAVLHFLTPTEGTRWIPARISVTPPDTTRQLTSTWPGIAVLRQDAASHTSTYIGTVLAGAGSLTELS